MHSELLAEAFELAELWRSLVEGRLFISETSCQGGRCFATLTSPALERARLPESDVRLLERVLHGVAQKVVASDAGLHCSTVSMRCSKTLRAMSAGGRVARASLIIVMAALSARGLPLPKARIERELPGATVVSAEFPDCTGSWPVTSGESEVLRMTLIGYSNRQLALARGTSQRTVANQIAAIFHKLRLSGRSAIRARAVEEHSRLWSAGRKLESERKSTFDEPVWLASRPVIPEALEHRKTA
jgi:DNA-binding NarL/FixJ family response regulator